MKLQLRADRRLAVVARGRHICDVGVALVGSAIIGYAATDKMANTQQHAADMAHQDAQQQAQMSQQQIDLERQQNQLSQQQFDMNKAAYDRYTSMYTPVEQQAIRDASNYDNNQRVNLIAGQAHTDVVNAYTQARDAQNRQLQSMGINPNSGRYLALNQQGAVQMGAADADAQNRARSGVYNTAIGLRANAVGQGQRDLALANQGMYYGLEAGNGANQTANQSIAQLGNASQNEVGAVKANDLAMADEYARINHLIMGSYSGMTGMNLAGMGGGGWGGNGGGVSAMAPIQEGLATGGYVGDPNLPEASDAALAATRASGQPPRSHPAPPDQTQPVIIIDATTRHFAHGGLVHAHPAGGLPSIAMLPAMVHPALAGRLAGLPSGQAHMLPQPGFGLHVLPAPHGQTQGMPVTPGTPHFASGGFIDLPQDVPATQVPQYLPGQAQLALKLPHTYQSMAQTANDPQPAPNALQSGGPVHGPGTPTSDSIPVRLSNGEYVINAATVRKLGTDYLDKLNAKGLAAMGLPTQKGAN